MATGSAPGEPYCAPTTAPRAQGGLRRDTRPGSGRRGPSGNDSATHAVTSPPRGPPRTAAAAVRTDASQLAGLPPDDEVRGVLQLVCGVTRARCAMLAVEDGEDARVWALDAGSFKVGPAACAAE